MSRKYKVIHISNLPSTFRGNVTRNGRFINYVKDFNKESFPSDDELGPTFPFNIIQTPRSNGKKLPQKQYAVGGKIPNVVAGGIAQSLGNNFFYMNGRKHSQGGIDIGSSDKTGIEVEGGEVVETNGNELKVYSAQPILNGASPAQLVMGGANPNKVFKAQEDFKDRNRINDDGSKYQNVDIEKNYYNKNDNTTVAKPVIQESIPLSDEAKRIRDIHNEIPIYNPYKARYNRYKGGNISIVSPEFDILTGIRGIANTFTHIISKYIGRKLPSNYAYRRTLQQELDDIINNNAFRKIPNNVTVPKGKTITTSSGKKISLHKASGNSHGGKAFSAGKVWKGTSSSGNKSKEIIIGVPGENAEWMVGHHGSYKGPYKFNDIEQGSGLFVPFDENNIANISTNGLKAYKPSIFNNRYIPIELNKKCMGGLSRDKDYGSKKKSYPTVAKKDFAGGHRSYPIPTKADAVDALRLAGLHGRSDVKAKVYNKYPELRKKGNVGLVVSINGNVKNGLIHSPSSTGGLRDKFAVGGTRINRHGKTWEYDEQNGAYVPITNRTINRTSAYPTTLPVSTSTLAKGTTSSDGKGQGKFKNLTTADWIGLGSNVAGSLASYFASRRAINKMRGPGQPTLISANKLKTKYNINPQLDRIREDKFEAYRDIDSNTASSRVSLARKQRVRNAAGQAANELYGNKENIETNLINQDRRNQQSVRQFNAQQYNQYIDRKTAFDNGIREAKVTNINNLFSGINAGIQDMISRYENRKALNNTISAMRASAPNVDDRIMRDAGVDYDEFIIRKRRKLGGKQSCR